MFDEVDTNIGGETANAVGRKMREIARHQQVLCITHLPQVAAAATSHFVVEKEIRVGRTVSTMRRPLALLNCLMAGSLWENSGQCMQIHLV